MGAKKVVNEDVVIHCVKRFAKIDCDEYSSTCWFFVVEAGGDVVGELSEGGEPVNVEW